MWFFSRSIISLKHDDVIKWKHFPRYWPFVRGIHRSPVNFPHKGQWRGALMFSLICVWINAWVNNRAAGDLRRRHAHYDVIVMIWRHFKKVFFLHIAVRCQYTGILVTVTCHQQPRPGAPPPDLRRLQRVPRHEKLWNYVTWPAWENSNVFLFNWCLYSSEISDCKSP